MPGVRRPKEETPTLALTAAVRSRGYHWFPSSAASPLRPGGPALRLVGRLHVEMIYSL